MGTVWSLGRGTCGVCRGVPEVGGWRLGLGSPLSGLGQIPCLFSGTLLPVSGFGGPGFLCWGAELPRDPEFPSPSPPGNEGIFAQILPVWETLIRMRQTSCFFALPQAALSLALKEPGPLFCHPAVRLSTCWKSLWGGGRGDLAKLGFQAAQDSPSSWVWESSRGPGAALPGFGQTSLCIRHFIAGP